MITSEEFIYSLVAGAVISIPFALYFKRKPATVKKVNNYVNSLDPKFNLFCGVVLSISAFTYSLYSSYIPAICFLFLASVQFKEFKKKSSTTQDYSIDYTSKSD